MLKKLRLPTVINLMMVPVLLVSLVLLTGCPDKAKTQADASIKQAETDLGAAKDSEAESYAAATYKSALDSLEEAKTAITAKNFSQALVYAQDASEKANIAVREANERKSAQRKGPIEEKPRRRVRTLK